MQARIVSLDEKRHTCRSGGDPAMEKFHGMMPAGDRIPDHRGSLSTAGL
jgi:hypothetical protein